jgi:hypothetical protein
VQSGGWPHPGSQHATTQQQQQQQQQQAWLGGALDHWQQQTTAVMPPEPPTAATAAAAVLHPVHYAATGSHQTGGPAAAATPAAVLAGSGAAAPTPDGGMDVLEEILSSLADEEILSILADLPGAASSPVAAPGPLPAAHMVQQGQGAALCASGPGGLPTAPTSQAQLHQPGGTGQPYPPSG